MNIVTSSDSNFYHCLKELTESVRKHYGKPAIVYDLGLTDEQKHQLDAIIVPIEVAADFKEHATLYKGSDRMMAVKTTHKPTCIRHYFEKFSEPMIFLDADCLFMSKVEETGFDVGVTCNKLRKNKNYYNGYLNAGVIFFNSPAKELLDLWAAECEKPNTTDQKALSEILSQTIDWNNFGKIQNWRALKIKVFNAKFYNNYHLTKHGKILHFIASKHDQAYYHQLLQGLRQGKNIRRMFNKIKRGKTGRIEKIVSKIKYLFNKI